MEACAREKWHLLINEIFDPLDEYVARNGYGKLFAGLVTILSVISFTSVLLGTVWLRTATTFVLLIAIIVLTILGVIERRRLHDRIELDADTINRYVDFIAQRAPFHIRKWQQLVEIEKNGDVLIRREVHVSRADDSEPHFLKVNAVYYGTTNLTPAARRRVKADAYRSNPTDGDRGTRAHRTYSWSVTPAGRPRHEVVVHLDGGLEDDEVVTVEWRWPRYSEDLRSCRSTELFDVRFGRSVTEFAYTIRLKNCGGVQPVVQRRGVPSVNQSWSNDDYIVTFGESNPVLGTSVGVVIDMNPRRQ